MRMDPKFLSTSLIFAVKFYFEIWGVCFASFIRVSVENKTDIARLGFEVFDFEKKRSEFSNNVEWKLQRGTQRVKISRRSEFYKSVVWNLESSEVKRSEFSKTVGWKFRGMYWVKISRFSISRRSEANFLTMLDENLKGHCESRFWGFQSRGETKRIF